jgi:hypothetical protein
MSNVLKREVETVYDETEFKTFARYRKNKDKLPKSYPCVILLVTESGMGHCYDWTTAHIIEPPKDYSAPQKSIYLLGVTAGLNSKVKVEM